VNWHHVLESTIGTAAALLLVVGGRKIAGVIAYRALRASLRLRGRLR
jgi:hypothetical protein